MKFSGKKSFELVGDLISVREFTDLKNGFQLAFPSEVKSILLNKQAILKTLSAIENVSGIFFRYGLADARNAASKQLIMVPCHNETISSGWPGSILVEDGYFTNNGRTISIENARELFQNFYNYTRNNNGYTVLNKIPTGYFWGKESILQLIKASECESVVFHFGFDPTHPKPCKRSQNILEALDKNGNSLNIFLDHGQCPTCTPDSNEDYIFELITAELNDRHL